MHESTDIRGWLVLVGSTPHDVPAVLPHQDGRLGVYLTERMDQTSMAKRAVTSWLNRQQQSTTINVVRVGSRADWDLWLSKVDGVTLVFSRWSDDHVGDVWTELPAKDAGVEARRGTSAVGSNRNSSCRM